MFTIYKTNFNYFMDEEFTTIGEAIEFGRSKGFEFIVYDDGSPKVIFNIFGGVRAY